MDLQELVISTKELLKNLINRSSELSELYINLDYEVANQRLVFLTEDLSVLLDVAKVLQNYYTEMELEELQEKLNFVLEGLETEDYQLVADLLLYELKPLLESWEVYLTNA